MTPQTVNAIQLQPQNALNFPAAYLQPPYFDPEAPAAANYGAVGAIIGHELSHSFSRSGSAFDSGGRLRNWWTRDDVAHFEATTAKLAAQYDTYKPFPDLAVNGQQTLGENIADLAGLAVAYDAYKSSPAGQTAPVQEGLSGDQQFFLAYGQSFAGKARDAAAKRCWRTYMPLLSTAYLQYTTSTHGTWPSTSSPETNCTSRRPTACASGKPM
jgi:putative endopeptidase